jgi:hypothetical protein
MRKLLVLASILAIIFSIRAPAKTDTGVKCDSTESSVRWKYLFDHRDPNKLMNDNDWQYIKAHCRATLR